MNKATAETLKTQTLSTYNKNIIPKRNINHKYKQNKNKQHKCISIHNNNYTNKTSTTTRDCLLTTTSITANQAYTYGDIATNNSNTNIKETPIKPHNNSNNNNPIKLIKEAIPFQPQANTNNNQLTEINNEQILKSTINDDIDKEELYIKTEPQPETLNTKPSLQNSISYKQLKQQQLSSRSSSHKQSSYRNNNHSGSYSSRKIDNNKIDTLNEYISVIETNHSNKKELIDTKANKVKQLQCNINALLTQIKMLNKESRLNKKSNRNILKENDMYLSIGDRTNEHNIYVNKDVCERKKEIVCLKERIRDLQEDTKRMKEMVINEDKEMMKLKDNVMKYHMLSNRVLKGKEGIKSKIVMYNNKIFNLKESISLIENKSEQFMRNVNLLVYESGK